MGVILSAISIALLLALLAGGGYYLAQEPVYRAQPMDGVRVGDPGDNLVGSNWSGDPSKAQIRRDTGSPSQARPGAPG